MTLAVLSGICVGLGLGFGTGSLPSLGFMIEPAFAFDGTTAPSTASLSPSDGLRAPNHPPDGSDKAKALTALEYAADQGMPAAQWKLGRMYADGDGVPQDALRAFKYFSDIANSHPDETPGTPQASFVANAFVALGRYYLSGIPNTNVKPNSARAHEMLDYAATYFGDADAQYELGRLYSTARQAIPTKRRAGSSLPLTRVSAMPRPSLATYCSRGSIVPRQAARGLMWLTLGRDCAGSDEAWVKPLYDSAFTRASDDERAMALVYLEGWLTGRRE